MSVVGTRLAKRIYGIYNQVKNDLFQLDAVALDNQRIGNEDSLQGDVMGYGQRASRFSERRFVLPIMLLKIEILLSLCLKRANGMFNTSASIRSDVA